MFTKGTRVHTSEGLRPIEALRVGDSVLTQPEDGLGEPVFRKIEAVMRAEGCVIRKISTFGQMVHAAKSAGNFRCTVRRFRESVGCRC